MNPYPGGAGYALSLSFGASEVLVENNIIMGANKLMVVRSSGAGSVVGYNYVDNGFIGNYPGWVEVGLNGSHLVGSHHMLFEGNLSFNYDSDDTGGGDDGVPQPSERPPPRLPQRRQRPGCRVDVRLLVAHLCRQRDGRSRTHGWLDFRGPRRWHIWSLDEHMGEPSDDLELGYAPGTLDQGPDPKCGARSPAKETSTTSPTRCAGTTGRSNYRTRSILARKLGSLATCRGRGWTRRGRPRCGRSRRNYASRARNRPR